MTVKELINELKKFPQEMRIIIPDGGAGGGYNRVNNIETIKVSSFCSGRGGYYGELTEYRDGNEEYEESEGRKLFNNHFDAVLIR